jgi:hypothetical protein
LIVLGDLVCRSAAVGGANLHVEGNLTVKDTFHGVYNHGSTSVTGNVDVGALVAEDYAFSFSGRARGHFVSRVKGKAPARVAVEKVLREEFVIRDDDACTPDDEAIFRALVAGKAVRRTRRPASPGDNGSLALKGRRA